MFGKFRKKQESSVSGLIMKDGIDYVTSRFADIICERIGNSKEIAYQFILEEIEAASQGNLAAQNFADNSGIPESIYKGSINNSRSEVDGPKGPQQLLIGLAAELASNRDLMVEFRIKVDDKIMKKFEFGRYAPAAPKLDDGWMDTLIAWAKGNNLPPRTRSPVIIAGMEMGHRFEGFPMDGASISGFRKLNRFVKDSIYDDGRLEIELNMSEISSLPPELCYLSDIHVLYLYGNKLEILPDELGLLENLYALDLGYNKLRRLPKSIGYLQHLETLSLHNNELRSLPDEIVNLSNLTSLKLFDNPDLVLTPDQKQWVWSLHLEEPVEEEIMDR